MFAGGLTQQSVSGWTAWGRQSSNPQFQDPLVIDARVNYSWIRGRHTLKTGYEYQHINTDIDDVHPKYGADSYGGQFSRPAGAAADAATFNLADFLFGARNTYELVNPFVFELRQRMHFGYLQDDWRVTPNLTFNLGLRYEFGTPQWEDDNYLTNFDPATNTLLQATRRVDLRPRARQPRHEQLRAARSASPTASTPKTVIRSAYGIELRPLQSARRREPAVVQRPARRADRDHAAAVAGAVRRQPGADDLLPHDAAGLPGRPERAGELQPAQRPRQLHPAGHQYRQRPELARHRCSASSWPTCWSTSPTSATAAAT